ncbi:MAG TPA: DJ-1/PfpI family protein [Methanomicrobia archaeon]|nr:DJ-1/PfpI family protein [Methanomicrobia archaeon]
MKALLFLATGFEEIESMCVVDTLRRAGVTTVLAGLQKGPIAGSRGVQMIPDRQLDELTVEDFDAVILPGGSPGYINLGADARVLKMVTKAYESGKLVAAICGAPSILGKLGIVRGKRATIFPGMEANLIGAEPVSDPVVVDGNVVTSRGPGTALEFAISLVELLVGKQKAREVRQGLVMDS